MSAIHAQRVLSYLSEQQSEMLDLLERLVVAESPSLVPEAQEAVQQYLSDALHELKFCVYYVPGHERSGGHLYARPARRQRGQPFQLLLGHCDTVWPLGTLATMPFASNDNMVLGASPLEPYNGTIAIEEIDPNVRFTVLCASDPYAVVGVLVAYNRRVDLVTGVATNTEAGVQLIEKLTDLPALNVLEKSALPELRSMLFAKLDVTAGLR